MLRMTKLLGAVLLLAMAGSAQAQMPAPGGPPAAGRRGPMQDMHGMRGGPDRQSDAHDGIIGVALALDSDTIGGASRLVVRFVRPLSPAYNAGIMRGDRLVAVDGQPVDGKSLDDVTKAIRGDVGGTVKLSLDRQGTTREISLTRVEPLRRMADGRMDRMREMMRMHREMMGSGPRPGPDGQPPR